MQVDSKQIGAVFIVKPAEPRLDAHVASSFKETMSEFIKEGHHLIALNLAEVEFIDSSGVRAIVSILKALGCQGKLVVCGARGAVLTAFKLTRLDKMFCLLAQEEEALAVLVADA